MRRAACVFLSFAFGVSLACSSDAVGIDGCRKIEEARCNRAAECGVDLGVPVHNDRSVDGDKQACIRFYRDACLHGMPVDPGSKQSDACTAAIQSGTCNVVLHPESTPECSFLSGGVDAGGPTSDAAASTDAASASDAGRD